MSVKKHKHTTYERLLSARLNLNVWTRECLRLQKEAEKNHQPLNSQEFLTARWTKEFWGDEFNRYTRSIRVGSAS